MAVAYLYKYITEDIDSLYLPFLQNIGPEKTHLIKTALKNNINTPLTSSAGRLFDAVAALTGLCNFSSFHAEAPMRLENMIDHAETGHYDYSMGATINPGPMIKGILNDIKLNIPVRNISTKFHNTMVQIILEAANRLRDETGITKIVLSGGTFQNRHLLSECENKLQYFNFEVFTHRQFPSNDGALALGQLVIAAKRREAGLIGLDPYN
jgi:hydrogenase maturation protein HypF